ncbi:hypothetical protein Q7P37_006199 [Cladosporium fusiforme]
MAASRSASFFRYTSGRWIYNEHKRLTERHLRFNVAELSKAAAVSIGRKDGDVQSIKKLAEGGFNRTFELTMNDGFQVIARLPYPSTQPKRLAVASEVATLDLVRHHGVPAPQIYGYSTDSNNPVGAEYILMEKVKGRALGDVWFTLSESDRIKVLSGIVENEARLFSIDLPACGSLYYDKDLPCSMGRLPILDVAPGKQLCIGPDVSLKFWYEKRSDLDIHRGPGLTTAEVLSLPATKEMAWLRKFGKPRLPFDRVYRDITEYQKSNPEDHYNNLEIYLQHAARLVPNEDWLNRPTIRHPDLNPNNIFISDESEVVSFIDWQHSKILPLFLQAGMPAHFQNYGDPESEDLVQPQLPDHLDELDEDDREKELELYRRRHLHFYYVGATAKKNDSHFQAMMHPAGMFRRKIFQHAGEPWEGNNIPLKADLIRMMQHWNDFSPPKGTISDSKPQCPLSFDTHEAEKVLDGAMRQEEADGQMDILRNVIGISSDGWVSHEGYEEAVSQASEMKKQAIEYAESDAERELTIRHWPFDDHDEDE